MLISSSKAKPVALALLVTCQIVPPKQSLLPGHPFVFWWIAKPEKESFIFNIPPITCVMMQKKSFTELNLHYLFQRTYLIKFYFHGSFINRRATLEQILRNLSLAVLLIMAPASTMVSHWSSQCSSLAMALISSYVYNRLLQSIYEDDFLGALCAAVPGKARKLKWSNRSDWVTCM